MSDSNSNVVALPIPRAAAMERIKHQEWRSGTALRIILNNEDDRGPQLRAINHLAMINSWSFGCKTRFKPFGDKTPLQGLQAGLLDHRITFTRALVVQPYDYSMPWQDIAEELAATSRRPLEVHIPPVKLASIHSPGRCWFIVFTRPGHTMRWLPEQETGIAPPGSQIIQPPKRSTSGEVV